MSLKLNGATSGYVEIDAPAVAGSTSITLPATSGGEFVVTDSNGRVGLGTNSPAANLHVKGNDIIQYVEATGTAAEICFRNNTSTGDNIRIGGSGNNLTFDTGGAESMRIDSSGNVGIGTTSPGTKFEVNAGHIRLSTSYRIGIGGTGASPNDAFVKFATNELQFFTNNSQKAAIDSSGRLLVGTSTSPSSGASYALAAIQGNTNSSTGSAEINLQRGEAATAITSGEVIGTINFTDNAGNIFGLVQSQADAAAGAGDYPGRIAFWTTANGASSPTERMRIHSNGQMSSIYTSGIGHRIGSTLSAGSNNLIQGGHSASNISNMTTSFIVSSNGNVTNTNNSYGAISDAKLKENIVSAGSQWDDLKALQVRNYNFKEETGQPTHTQIGLIAQEAELVSPGLVSESPDRDADGNDLGTVTKSVNYSVLYMKAVKALQEAMERIETLETANASLEARLTALEGGAA